jgi:hypothetical protein
MAVYMPKGAPKNPGAAFALEGFDREAFEKTEVYKRAQKNREINKLYPDDPMNPELLKYWENKGCKKELFDTERNEGLYQYSVFTPIDMDMSKRYAMLFISHGGGGNNYGAEGQGFNNLVSSEKVICVYANNGGKSNDEVEPEFKRIYEALIEKGYPIDRERVYAVGFSAGADASGVLGSAWPELIAGIAPMPGGNVFEKGGHWENPENYAKNLDKKMPMICVAGTMDGGDVYPLTTDKAYKNFNIWMSVISKINNFENQSLEHRDWLIENGNPTQKVFGFDFQKTWEEDIEGLHYYCGEYYDENNIPYARFMSAEGIPHMMPNSSVGIVWEYLKHFRRDIDTGESIYDPVAISGVRDI